MGGVGIIAWILEIKRSCGDSRQCNNQVSFFNLISSLLIFISPA